MAILRLLTFDTYFLKNEPKNQMNHPKISDISNKIEKFLQVKILCKNIGPANATLLLVL